jgi:hypothetical protein
MRRIALTFAALFVFAGVPVLSAAEADDVLAIPQVSAQIVGVDATAPAQLQLSEIQIESRAVSDDAAAAQVAQRGSFWWLVGAIVIAGVALAILL